MKSSTALPQKNTTVSKKVKKLAQVSTAVKTKVDAKAEAKLEVDTQEHVFLGMESGDKQLAQIQKKLEKEEINLGLAAKIVELESQVSQVKSRIGQLEDKKSTG